MERLRGFEEVSEFKKEYFNYPTKLPTRADPQSAGYDFYVKDAVVLEPGESKLIFTDVKAYMLENEVLLLHIRSSLGVKFGVILKNGTGVIDASYYNNPTNDGNIGLPLVNMSKKKVVINAGERVAQGIFMPYLVADTDFTLNKDRSGGLGSSGA